MTNQYKEAGVDISAGNSLVQRIRPFIEATYGPQVRGAFGHYGALFSLEALGLPDTLLAAGTDGVGTKVELTRKTNSWKKIGQDLVAMCANDILCLGARPLFFLDYFASGKLEADQAAPVIEGIAAACREIGCALIGGETAEMPGLYRPGEFDLAGFIVGSVKEKQVIDGSHIRVGDTVLGLASSGFHANGYSLIRKIIKDQKLDLDEPLAGEEKTLGEQLTEATRLYGAVLEPLLEHKGLHGLAHITGGGLLENPPRILPPNCRIRLDRSRWERPAFMKQIQTLGKISDQEMVRVFNDGIGMLLIVASSSGKAIHAELEAAGERVWDLGKVEERVAGEPAVELV